METFAGLPAHPFFVHLPVVLLPLAALGIIALSVVPRWRRSFGVLVIGLLVAATASTWLARISGQRLVALTGGGPEAHAAWGSALAWVVTGFASVAGGWLLWARRGESFGRHVGAALSSVLALGTVVMAAYVGHSGAEATWGSVLGKSQVPTPTGSTEPASSSSSGAPETGQQGGFTLEQVAQHASPEDCWAIVGDQVYDLSAWGGEHPGGRRAISNLCGTDATADFQSKHGGQQIPRSALDRFRIGVLKR